MSRTPASAATVEKEAEPQGSMSIDGVILDIDYAAINGKVVIRVTVKGQDGKTYDLIDDDFKPYFYFVPSGEADSDSILRMGTSDGGRKITPVKVEEDEKSLLGKPTRLFRVYMETPSDIPKFSSYMMRYGKCYEYDIPFSRRYGIDKDVTPLHVYRFSASKTPDYIKLDGMSFLNEIGELSLNTLWFDIEVYNPLEVPRENVDPVIMLSYKYISGGKEGEGVITFKKIDRPFVEVVKDETALISRFVEIVNQLDIDVISGYNSANFDIRYMIARAKALGIDFNLSRGHGDTRIERHGLVDKVKIGGRVHVDMYLVIKFVSVVGAAEHLLKLNSYTLKNVYEAISEDKKISVEKKSIWKLWDGGNEDLELLAEYNLNDSYALMKVYNTFIPIMIELSRTTGNVLSDVSVSTTGQLVEYLLMRYARRYNEVIPNKPSEYEIEDRLKNPIIGAYVKTPDPGIYEHLAIFDFRGLYPSIIISHNIDPSTLCADCKDYFESPTGARFDKNRKGISPMILELLINQRKEVKKAYKKDPNNIFLGSRSQALKITANSFYGYLGYARSRWYSRDCASSVTAWGRQYIAKTIEEAEKAGLKVIYGDTDSIVVLLGDKTDEEALAFMKAFNASLPGAMELELEDFFVRAVFVGKKHEKDPAGAKKKYAMLSTSGRIKIRGFELVRRDWSKIARDTQRSVLETILKEGSAEKAANIVKDVVQRLRSGTVPLSELAISTQLRKGIDKYDSKSPELSAAKKAVEAGVKSKDEVEHAVISYVITSHGGSVSDKAELEEMAKDYDADYYINSQVMPAVMKILKELNYNEDELKNLGKQKKL
ncbi:MAG: DNA-directed DNA polymerase [Candidatus Marsarchaeota archaeon]|nr:DNA-directed DNA polymerase [Candidatus Marsarchaeota archaeon]